MTSVDVQAKEGTRGGTRRVASITSPLLTAGGMVLNAITVPEPPAAAGLFDPGPRAGLYAPVLFGYLVKLGLGDRPAAQQGRVITMDHESGAKR